ncbi:uncharacterized protein LOC128212410 [Mya arenaria]|uniref:uncharacterized protein LOC128212410 n=1 Tax=Mya arenaria TaxID=6604 RepID=UPI0022E62089|nr:uncharacterized protein LOC128212410 [Mya arenaria]
MIHRSSLVTAVIALLLGVCWADFIPLPPFSELKKNYPGFAHFRGIFRHHELVHFLGLENETNVLLHDTSALRLSYSLNEVGGVHSLGSDIIRLSKYGRDSVKGKDGRQYIFHPLAFGPYLADKYGLPSVTQLHKFDPDETKTMFKDRQGIMRVITYTRENEPKGHIVLWDCGHFHQSRDLFEGHTLLSVEFWESPDSHCNNLPPVDITADSVTEDEEHFLQDAMKDAVAHNLRHTRTWKH